MECFVTILKVKNVNLLSNLSLAVTTGTVAEVTTVER